MNPLLKFSGRAFTYELRGINRRLTTFEIEYPFYSELITGRIIMKIPGPVCDGHYVGLNHPLNRTLINNVGLILIHVIPLEDLEPRYL